MIKTKNLVKYYDKHLAVKGVNLNIKAGTFYGLLGPNGAGKTTTIKMLAMLLRPTSGEIHLSGDLLTRGNKNIKAYIGIVPQHFSLQRELTVVETLMHHGLLHGMKRKAIKERIQALITFADMEKEAKKPVAHLSGGNKRKLMIIRAVMHQPKILFLDEPTVGLDANIRRTIWDLLKKLKTEGLTIIITTHYIEEARTLCDVIGMMNGGEIVNENTPQGYLSTIDPYAVEQFDGKTTHYFYFKSREQASEFSKTLQGNVLIRTSNLEDVYVAFTDAKVRLS